MIKTRKIPLRKCVGCGQMKEKKELIRILRDEESGRLMTDAGGKRNGRGCYICKNMDCLALAEKNRGIDRSLKCRVSADMWNELTKELEIIAGK